MPDTILDFFIATFDEDIFIIGEEVFRSNNNILGAFGNKIISIELSAFRNCSFLEFASFPLATTIKNAAFAHCSSLKSILFPLVTTIEHHAFYNCMSLESASFGTEFKSLTPITLGVLAFYHPSILTSNVDLILGANVQPERIGNDWNEYVWKNIEVVGIKEEAEEQNIFYIGNNR